MLKLKSVAGMLRSTLRLVSQGPLSRRAPVFFRPCTSYAQSQAAVDGPVDHYKVLGVPADASSEDLKEAYRELAKRYHPDVATGSDAAEVFKLVGEAYTVLSTPHKRELYDLQREDMRARLRRKNEGVVDDESSLHRLKHAAAADATFRKSMFRANERFREGAAVRGSMNRANRARVHVPTKQESFRIMMYPMAVVGLWAVNYLLFM